MKLGIMQPYFFPYLGYWQLINAVDKYVVYDDVAYIKGGWINRNNILVNGMSSLITLPLEKSSSLKKINEINIINNDNVKNKLLKTVQMTYKKAPFFDTVMPMISDLLFNNSNIAMLNYKTILKVKEFLNMDTEIILSSELQKNNSLKSQDKVIYICKELYADNYINAIGGQELYSKEEFAKHNIKLNFIKMNEIEYKQFSNDFVPNLSIIDVLMFNSPEQIKEMLDDFVLL